MSKITCGPIIMGLNRNQSNAVTVPADKLAELQRKAKLADELLLILMKARDDIQYYADKTVENIDAAIAKAKGEQ